MQRGAQGEQAARAIRLNLFLICSSNRLVLETAFSDRTMALLRSGFSVAVT